jgi:hypothetical protein
MPHPLDGVNSKIERAKAHIGNLEQEIRAFAKLKPYTVRIDREKSAGGGTVKIFAVDNKIGIPDVSISLTAGEAVYQMRSALDHLIHQLVIANGQAAKLEDSRRHQFPIFESSDGYVARARGMIDGVADGVARIIESQQPYKRTPHSPHQDPLWILQDLNNTDKHRLIPVAVVGLNVLRGRDSADDVTYADLFEMRRPGPLKHGEMLARLDARDMDEHISADLTSTVSFEQAPKIGGLPVSMYSVLWHLIARVGNVIERFRVFFS